MKILTIKSDILDSNTHIVYLDRGIIIVDAGVRLDKIIRYIDKPILAILITHAHYDHIYYIDDYIDYFNLKPYISSFASKSLYDSSLNYGKNLSINHDISYFDLLEDNGVIENSISYFTAQGHSDCSLIYKIEDALFTGDVLFKVGIGRTDFISGDKSKMIDSLKQIEKLDFKIIYPGHGAESTRQEQERNLRTYIRFLSR